MPIDRRWFNIYEFAPGIKTGGSAFGGGASTANALLLDGMDTRDPAGGTDWSFFNYNIIEEVQIQGIGANAEYGSFTGGIVNTISKSGGNRYADHRAGGRRRRRVPGYRLRRPGQRGRPAAVDAGGTLELLAFGS